MAEGRLFESGVILVSYLDTGFGTFKVLFLSACFLNWDKRLQVRCKICIG